MVQDTEKALEQEKKDKQIAEIKAVVKRTLEALETCKVQKDEIEKRIKYLRMDLDDLKEGKLDRIEERQTKDPDAKANAVILIIKIKETVREVSPWYWPYTFKWHQPIWMETTNVQPINWAYSSSGNSANFLTYTMTNASSYDDTIPVNCSVAKDYSAGTYDINGKIVNFR